MIGLLDRLKGKRQAEAATGYALYQKLVRQAADADLTEKQVEALANVAKELNIGDADLERDVDAVRAVNLKSVAAADLEGAEAALSVASGEWSKWDEETRRIFATRQGHAAELQSVLQTAQLRKDKAQEAASDLRQLRREFWRVLGAENPDVLDRRRHLIHVFAGEGMPVAPADSPGFQSFEALMLDGNNAGDLATLQFLPAPGQTQAELDGMLTVAKDWQAGRIVQPAFLLASDTGRMPWGQRSKTIFIAPHVLEDIEAMGTGSAMDASRIRRWTPPFDADRYTWLPAPGQSPSELDKLLKRVRAAFDSCPLIVAKRRIQREDEERERQYDPTPAPATPRYIDENPAR